MKQQRIKVFTYNVWIAKCDNCGTNFLTLDKPTGSKTCDCGEIAEYKQSTWTGPELKNESTNK